MSTLRLILGLVTLMATLSQPSMAAERTSSRGKADGARRAARVQSSHSAARAEVYRLTEELHRLAVRQAWAGVEQGGPGFASYAGFSVPGPY